MSPSGYKSKIGPRTSITSFSHRYTRFVVFMKLVLPAFAVALVLLMILWPGRFGDSEGFRLSFADLTPDPNEELGVTRAKFAGTDSNNRPFIITAERATQQSVDFQIFNLNILQADLTLNNGTWISIAAIGGVFDRDGQTLKLDGPIDIYTDIGYELHAKQASIDLEAGEVETKQPVNGHGPFGTIRANNMSFTSDDSLIFFGGGVQVILNAIKG